MRNIYYKSEIGNFGDDLNGWLWSQIFENINQIEDSYLIGIGSILNGDIEKEYNLQQDKKKIIFGTGVRPSSLLPQNVDDTWDIRFLRGPLSVSALKNKHEYITDGAYALRQLELFENLKNTPKQYEVSLMPYFRSLTYLDWKTICDELGYHYISPCSELGVESTLKEIAASKKLITEAMHGAIVADILRVPWSRFVFSSYYFESPYISEFKWWDWLLSIGIKYIKTIHIDLQKRNRLSRATAKITFGRIFMEFFSRKYTKEILLNRLRGDVETYLSDENIILSIDKKIAKKIEELKLQ